MTLAFLLAVTLIAMALFWSASESHYRNCVEAIGVRTANDTSSLARFARQEVKSCSRSPF